MSSGKAVALDVEWPEFHEQGMGCGLEDRNITDRYEAMRYGWDEALDACQRAVDNAIPELASKQVTFEAQQAAIDMLTRQLHEGDQRYNTLKLVCLNLIAEWHGSSNHDEHQCGVELAARLGVDPITLAAKG